MLTALQVRLKSVSRWLPVALLPFAAQAQAPANDNCSTATVLTVAAACTNVTSSNQNATASAGVPTLGCGGNTTTGSNDVWFSMVVPASGGVTVTTSEAAGSAVDDTVLELYAGSCTSLTALDCNDDAGAAGFSTLTVTGQTPGTTLYARVMSFGASPTGAFSICATIPPPAPANDNPAGAISLPLAATCTPVNGTTASATTTPAIGYSNPGCAIAVNPKDVWYTFTTAASGQPGSTAVTITVTGAPAGQVRVFSSANGAAGPFISVGCSDAPANNSVAPPLELRGLTPATTYYVFVSGFGSNDTQGAFTICATILNVPANDAAVMAIYTLGKVASSFSSPVTVQALIRNMGSTTRTNLPVTLNVSGATTFSNVQTIASLAPGASTMVTFTYPITATTGTNTLTVTVPADDQATNNSQTFTQTISASDLSYAAGTTFTGSAGVSAAGAVIAVGYRTAGPAVVSTVTPYFLGTGTAGATYDVLIYSAAANGQPGTLLYTSPARPRPAGTAGAVTTDAVSIPNVPVNGAFFVGIRTIGANNLGIAYQTETPLRGGTFFFTTNNGTSWTDINTSPLNSRLVVDVTLRVATATRNEALAATVGLSPNPAQHSFRLDVPAGRLHAASATLLNALGQVVYTRQLRLPAAGGTATFDVSTLAPGVYTLQLKTGADLVVKRLVVE